MADTIETRVLGWMATGRVGASSTCMARHLTGQAHDGFHPRDSADFGRCLGLLDAVPELRSRLSDMAAVSPYWTALVEHWDEIERRVREEDGADTVMRSLLDPIEDADPAVVRLGNGITITMSFGR